jgi:hypothetical protein
MMEAVQTSETLANLYQPARRYNPQDSHLHTHRRQNLKSYLRSCLKDAEYEEGPKPNEHVENYSIKCAIKAFFSQARVKA